VEKRAFSLVELMIVIVIVGVVYTLAITNLKAPKAEDRTFSLKTLKEDLHSFSKDNKSVRLLCQENCQDCALYSDGKKLQDFKSFFTKEVSFYRYDFFQGMIALQRDSCFDFTVDANGVSDQVIIVYDTKAYDYTPYFTPTKEYDSLADVVKAKEKLIGNVD